MARPKKVVTEAGTEIEAPEEQASSAPAKSSKDMTPQERAAKRVADKKKAIEKLEADALEEVKEASDKYLKSKVAPIFVPYKDRDGKIVPALVMGASIGEKRNADGEFVLNEGREIVQEAKISVWVFSHTSEPHRAVWSVPEGY